MQEFARKLTREGIARLVSEHSHRILEQGEEERAQMERVDLEQNVVNDVMKKRVIEDELEPHEVAIYF